jgi:hypothetical protein
LLGSGIPISESLSVAASVRPHPDSANHRVMDLFPSVTTHKGPIRYMKEQWMEVACLEISPRADRFPKRLWAVRRNRKWFGDDDLVETRQVATARFRWLALWRARRVLGKRAYRNLRRGEA